jgi:hypothetical protein
VIQACLVPLGSPGPGEYSRITRKLAHLRDAPVPATCYKALFATQSSSKEVI